MDSDNKVFLNKIIAMTGATEGSIQSLYNSSHLNKHSDLRNLFMEKLELSYGYANTLAHLMAKTDGDSQSKGKSMSLLLDEIYINKKSQFRPIHDLIMARIETFGHVEIAPKKGYLSLRGAKQFAMIGPKTNTRMEIGINLTGVEGDDILLTQPKGSMCKFVVKITTIDDVNEILFNWLEAAYKQAQ